MFKNRRDLRTSPLVNRRRNRKPRLWFAATAMLVGAFAVALLLYAIAPDANDRELRAQGGVPARTAIPSPPEDGQRTIFRPGVPHLSAGSVTGVGSVALDWNDVPNALSYQVQVWNGTGWTRLPANGTAIQFSGSSAQIDGLPGYDVYYFNVRAVKPAGNSGWSDLLALQNDASDQATSTPTPVIVLPATATATATNTPTATPTATPNTNSCHLLSDAVVSTRSVRPVCDYPKLQDTLPFFACQWNSTVLSRRSGQPTPYPEVYRDAFDVLIKTNGDKAPVVQFLENNGTARVFAGPYSGNNVQGRSVPVSILGELSELPQVIWVRKSVYPTPSGSIPPGGRSLGDDLGDRASQANAGNGSRAAHWHGADVWLTAVPGLDGSGVNVGIIDTSFNGFRELQTAGLLPTNVPSYCDFVDSADEVAAGKLSCETTPVPNATIDEVARLSHGTLVAEALMDIAPGADQYIARVVTREDMRMAAEWMRDQDEDVHVINASLDWSWEGVGDGNAMKVVENGSIKTVATAVADGVVWVNAAGNWASEGKVFHWDSSDGLMNRWDPNGWLSFTGGPFGLEEPSLRATLADAEPPTEVLLRWGNEGADEAELDLLVCDNEDCSGTRRDISFRFEGIETAQFEKIELEDWGSVPDELYMRVCRHPGSDGPDWLQVGINGAGDLVESTGSLRTIRAPGVSDSSGMLTVGAAGASIDGNTVDYDLADFSGRGPTTDGRIKPDIVGVHNEPSSLLATRIAEGTPFASSSWTGTSQAAPHVAGLVALVIQNMRMEDTVAGTPSPIVLPTEVVGYLKNNAIYQQAEGGDPDAGNPDANNSWGHGFAMLPAPFGTLDADPEEIEIGEVTTVTAMFRARIGKTYRVSPDRDFLGSPGCDAGSRSAENIDIRSGLTEYETEFTGCAAGNATIRLLELPGEGTTRCWLPWWCE